MAAAGEGSAHLLNEYTCVAVSARIHSRSAYISFRFFPYCDLFEVIKSSKKRDGREIEEFSV
jgi:hypothetical protein